MMKFSNNHVLLQLILLIILYLTTLSSSAEEDLADLEYVAIEPVIVTNYQKKSAKKPGFIQIKAQLSVRGTKSAELLSNHMPLIRAYIIDFLSFTDEKLIKDSSKRTQLRLSITKGLKTMLTEQVGQPLIEELVITHFMWD